MGPRLAVLPILFALLAVSPASAASKKLYVSLGDSFAVGVQPTSAGKAVNTRDGYPNQLAALAGNVTHVSLGCGWATTRSMMTGSRRCLPALKRRYKNKSTRTSQLVYAERYLKRNRRRLAFVTIDIGGNDLLGCVKGGVLNTVCLGKGVSSIAKNTRVIAKRLRSAAGPKVKMAAMTYPNPLLAGWLNQETRGLAGLSGSVLKTSLNREISKAFKRYRFKIADVAGAYGTYTPLEQTVDVAGFGAIPVAVANVCRLTWSCTPAPQGPDIHPNADGYAVIAREYAKVLGITTEG